MEKELLNPKKENRAQDYMKNSGREALYHLANHNKNIKSKNVIRTQDEVSRLVIACTERHIKEMFSYLSNKETFQEDKSDQTKMYQRKVKNWTKSWEHNLTKEERE